MNATGQRDDGLSEALHVILWLGPARYDIVAVCAVSSLGRVDMPVDGHDTAYLFPYVVTNWTRARARLSICPFVCMPRALVILIRQGKELNELYFILFLFFSYKIPLSPLYSYI